jgi:hypothetical protein
MTKPVAITSECSSVGSRRRIKVPSPRWIGFSEDDGWLIAAGADIRRQCRSFLQRAEESPRRPFHLCASDVGHVPPLRRQRATAFGFRH